jgi:2-iminobutanoate/2-iminopropanoate deaminase
MKRVNVVAMMAPIMMSCGTMCMNITSIQTNKAPEPIGPYSQAVQVSTPQLLFISGQIPLDPVTGVLYVELAAATEQVMKNVWAVLQQANMDFKNVVKTTIYLTNMNDFAVVNRIYADYFKGVQTFPARETVQVAALPKGACVEISMIAAQ